jgi:membrane protein DedA with SNARE-associated domain/membrane-associated phospholipid phosphatase
VSLFPVLLTATIGAITGDGASYWLGHHYQQRLTRIWPFSHHPQILKKGEAFFHRHGGKSVLFGRFVGPVRPVIPLVAGISGMRPLRFIVVNVLSAIGWALVYTLSGVFFGASLAVAGIVSARLAILILIVVAGVWGVVWLCRKALSLFENKVPAGLAAVKRWATSNTPHQGSLLLPVKQLLSYLMFREKGEELLFAFLVIVLFTAGWGFLSVLQDVLAKDPLVLADQAVYHFLQSLRTPWMDQIFVAVTELGDSFVNIVMACAVLLILLVGRCRRAAVFWTIAVVGILLAVQLLKATIHLPRPVSIYQGASAYGFPSGHAANNIVLYGFLAIIMVRQLAATWRWALFSAVVLIAFIIGFSRLYLGAHWLSDVLGGYFIGIGWATLLGIAYLKKPDKPAPARLLGVAVAVVAVVAGGWHIVRQHDKDLSFYATSYTTQTMKRASYMAGGWQELPAYRIDIAGEKEQPLTIQWAGSIGDLDQYLMSRQWELPPSLNLKDFLKLFSSNTPIGELPVLPRLHNGRTEALRLVRFVDDSHRWVLRLWPTRMVISDNNASVFEGTIDIQKRWRLAGLIFLSTDSGRYDLALDGLETMLKGHFDMVLVTRGNWETILPDEDRKVNWHGEVLLIKRPKTVKRENNEEKALYCLDPCCTGYRVGSPHPLAGQGTGIGWRKRFFQIAATRPFAD